jgi:hypothetical protein
VIGDAGGLAGGRLVDCLGTSPAFLLAGSLGAGAVAVASCQHALLAFALLYAAGCGVIAALASTTSPSRRRSAPPRDTRARPAIVCSLLAGASIGAMYTLQGIYTNELVGETDLSLLMGAHAAVFATGGATGPVLAGTVFAATGSCAPVVLLTAAALAMSAVLMSRPGSLRPSLSRVTDEAATEAGSSR